MLYRKDFFRIFIVIVTMLQASFNVAVPMELSQTKLREFQKNKTVQLSNKVTRLTNQTKLTNPIQHNLTLLNTYIETLPLYALERINAWLEEIIPDLHLFSQPLINQEEIIRNINFRIKMIKDTIEQL